MYNAILEFFQSPAGGITVAVFVVCGIIGSFVDQFDMDGHSWSEVGNFFKKVFIVIVAIFLLPFPSFYDKLTKPRAEDEA